MADPAAAPVVTQVYAQPGVPVLMPPIPGFPSLNLTMGAVVVSGWASVFTFAVVCAAAYVYYISFPKDRLAFKILVGGVWLLSLVDTVMSMIWNYRWVVDLWGMIPGTTTLPHEFYVNIVCCALSTLVVQFFYAWRIWTISQKGLIIPGLVVSCAIAQLCFVIWVEATWGPTIQFANLGIVLPVGYGWAVSGVIGDCIITVSLFYYLRVRNKESAASQQTRLTFNAIISRAVQANILSLVSQIMTFVLFKINAGMYFFLNDVILCKIYCFSLLTSLNARRSSNALFNTSSRTGLTSQSQNGMSLSNLSNGRRAATGMGTYGGSKHAPVVRITETVDVATDDWEQQSDKKPQYGQV